MLWWRLFGNFRSSWVLGGLPGNAGPRAHERQDQIRVYCWQLALWSELRCPGYVWNRRRGRRRKTELQERLKGMEEKTSELKEFRRVTQKVQVEEQRLGHESMEGPFYTSKIRECSQVTCQDHMDLASPKPSGAGSRTGITLVNHISSPFPLVLASQIFIPQMLVIREYLI